MEARHGPVVWPLAYKGRKNIRQRRIPQIPPSIPPFLLLIRPKEPPSAALFEHVQLSTQEYAALAVLLAVVAARWVRVRVERGAELADDEVPAAFGGEVAEPVNRAA